MEHLYGIIFFSLDSKYKNLSEGQSIVIELVDNDEEIENWLQSYLFKEA